MYKNILFDFDGTLVDTNDLIILSLQEASRKYLGRDLTKADLNSILGKYLDEQMRCLSPEHWKDMVEFYREFYGARQDEMVAEFPGIRDMLEQLKKLGCRIAVVSAKGRGGIEHGLARFGLKPYIDVVISAYDIQHNKPHPEPALKAMEALHAEAADTLLVGDSPYDILCARNAGISSALVGWTIFPQEELLALKPDHFPRTALELVDVVRANR